MKITQTPAKSPEKLPYQQPTLTPYGSIKEITQEAGGSDIDGMGGQAF